MTQLIFERGSYAGERKELTIFPVTMGRSSENIISIDDEKASRFHLEIHKRGRLFIIKDKDSKNGTYVNGDRVVNAVLQNGDKILVGSTEITFATASQAIHITQEVMHSDMVMSEDLGLKGPINIQENVNSLGFKPRRLAGSDAFEHIQNDPKSINRLFNFQSDILVMHTMEDATGSLLKSIGKISEKISRAALFSWDEKSRQLLPVASRHYVPGQESFLISKRSFEDVISRDQGLVLEVDNPNITHDGSRNRMVLPIHNLGRIISVLHIEMDASTMLDEHEIKILQALMARIGPTLDSFFLRQEVDAWMVGMVETIIATIEAKDTYTVGHSERVCNYSMSIADDLKLSRDIKKQLMISSLCHDIGKIGIPDSILKKASLLSSDEYEEMKLHPTIGADIVSHMPNSQRFISGIKYHHEKWDGTGYPEGLKGEDIPFFGRIIAVADVFDAMVSGRSYSGFVDESDAVERILEEGELFDPEILKSLVNAYNKGNLTIKTSTQSQKNFDDVQETIAAGTPVKKAT